jgi:predicted enzyme related to lactoylglutathione lyase
MSSSQGRFVWYELATTDVAAATAFYKDVVGWTTEDYQGAGMHYTRWQAGGEAIGGLMTLPDQAKKNGAPPHWLAYVMADDVDALTAKAKKLGATTIVEPSDIPNIGRFSVIGDPQGAVIALFKPQGGPDMPPPGAEPRDRHFVWHELLTNDREAALRFYSELFGWQKTDAVKMPNGVYQMYGRDGQTLGGMMNRPEGYPAPPHWLYYIMVSDLDAALERVKKGGGRVMNGPMEVPGGSRVAQCDDPQGAAFALNGK